MKKVIKHFFIILIMVATFVAIYLIGKGNISVQKEDGANTVSIIGGAD